MSTAVYRLAAKTARDMIRKFGKSMIYVQKKEGQTYNPGTMRYEPEEARTPFRGVRTNAKAKKNPELPVQIGDCIVLAASTGLPTPSISDQVLVDGEAWNVVDGVSVAPGDTALLLKILIRRG